MEALAEALRNPDLVLSLSFLPAVDTSEGQLARQRCKLEGGRHASDTAPDTPVGNPDFGRMRMEAEVRNVLVDGEGQETRLV